SFDPLFALLVIVVLVLPYLIWLIRTDVLWLPLFPPLSDLGGRVLGWALLAGGLLLAMAGILILVALNSQLFSSAPVAAPILYRPPVDALARDFVYFFAIAPPLAGTLISGFFGFERVVGGSGVALLMSGMAIIVATGDLVYLRRQRLLRAI